MSGGDAPGADGSAAPEAADGPQVELSLTLDAMAHGGTGLGRAADGRVVFVDGGLPGEEVDVVLTEEHERYARARLASLPAAPSPDRVAVPPCPYFGPWPDRGRLPERHCGGCQLQHAAYEAQLRYKSEVLADALRRIGGVDAPPVAGAVGMSDPWAYRNRIDVRPGDDGLGFVSLDDVTVVGIDTCLIARPELIELLAALDPGLPPEAVVTLRVGAATGDRMIVFHGLDAGLDDVDEVEVEIDASVVIAGEDGSVEVVAGNRYLFERLEGRLFAVPPTSFFQVNTPMAEVLIRQVRDAVPRGTDRLIDLYSGVGTFAVHLADRAREVWAIESDPAAVEAAATNADGLDHVTLVEADAAEGLAWLSDRPDVVVVDPPRAGLAREVVRLLAHRSPHTIVYVSCDPSTLARDVRQLVAGGYRLERSAVVDMFPQTYHVESVSILRA